MSRLGIQPGTGPLLLEVEAGLVRHVLRFLLTLPPEGSLGQQYSTLAAVESHLDTGESPDAGLLAAPGSIASELLA